MGNSPNDHFEKQLNQVETAVKTDVLQGYEPAEYPTRIDRLARLIAREGPFMLKPGDAFKSNKQALSLSRSNFDEGVRSPYLKGIRKLTGNTHYANAIGDDFPVGDLVYQYADLVSGLESVDREDVDPGEVLGRLIIRELQRRSDDSGQLAQSLRPETRTPRALVEQICANPELTDDVQSVIAGTTNAKTLAERLGAVELATYLWDHQREALRDWLKADGNGYVNMATATGKTVLGLAAVGYCVDSGSLHPGDENWLKAELEGDLPEVGNLDADDVLIVTTDDLLGVQWARLFQQHCHTPPEYTQIVDSSIRLPWGKIDIRSARALADVNPRDYRLAIFDEVHNYSSGSGWGENLLQFIDSSCPVLALTGSETDALADQVERAQREFECVRTYRHREALEDGVIPDFEWMLQFTPVDADSASTLSSLQKTAGLFDELVDYQPGTYRLRDDALSGTGAESVSNLRESKESATALARAIREAELGDDAPDLLRLADGLSNRQTHRWNLRLEHDIVRELVEEAMEDERPCLILTRSYDEASALFKLLYDDAGIAELRKLERDDDAATQDKRIKNFDSLDTGQKVLIGPGKRIGTGIDIKTIEVGVNLARPGTGLSTSLVQRLGRLLRKAGGTDTVSFYHLLGIPPEEAVIPPDGTTYIRNVCEFFAQVKAPGTDGIMKLPEVAISDAVTGALVELEALGSRELQTDGQLNSFEQAYVDAIRRSDVTDEPVVTSAWYEQALDAADTPLESERSDRPADKDHSSDGEVDKESGREGTAAEGQVRPQANKSRHSPVVVNADLSTVESDGSLQLTIRTANGEPLGDTFVTLSGEDDFAAFGVTDAEGAVVFQHLPPGRCTMTVHHFDYPVRTKSMKITPNSTQQMTKLPPQDSARESS